MHEALPYLEAEVIWAARWEMARTVEDVLARRTRALLLNARAAIAMAPRVAELLAAELDQGTAWQRTQIDEFTRLATAYLPTLIANIRTSAASRNGTVAHQFPSRPSPCVAVITV